MKDYKENFSNAVDYAISKTKSNAWKLILLGIMGSIYVAIAYIAFIYILATFNGVINSTTIVLETSGITYAAKSINVHGGALVVGAAIFPVGIILILFLGGSLFTSDNLTSIAVIIKKVKITPVILKWMYTLLGNLIGALLAAGIIRAGNIFASEDYQLLLGYLAGKKINLEWYYTIFSGILCNIIVAGSVWASLASKHSSAKIFLLYFPIWLFAITGFQHVVANAILFSMTWFYSINPAEQSVVVAGINFAANDAAHSLGHIPKFIINSTTPSDLSLLEQIDIKEITKQWIGIGKFSLYAIFSNMIPAAIGNWFSGAILLPFAYYWLSSYKYKVKNIEDTNLNNNDHHSNQE